jgi:hypothetical protein
MNRRAIIILAASLAALGTGGCATSHSEYAYDGGDWSNRRPYEGELQGPGVASLDPWLLETAEGRAIVTLGFREAGNGFVSEDVAHRANIWFRRYADQDCDLTITDPEIRTALVAAAGQYLRQDGPIAQGAIPADSLGTHPG